MEVIPEVGEGCRLFYNENLFLPSHYYKRVMEAVREDDIRFYPTPWAERLVKALSSYLNVDEGAILPGAGADDVLRVLMLEANCIGIVEPTYSLYSYLADSLGKEVKVRTYEEVRNGSRFEGCDLIIANSPNNPTGSVYEEDVMESLASHGTLVVDEAYVEFSGREGYLRRALEGEGNFVVVRTFSKAWGLAGLRVGYAIASPDYVERIKRLALPFQVSAASEAMAIRALELRDVVFRSIEEMKAVRKWFEDRLESLGLLYSRSETNFSLITNPLARRIWEELKARGIEARWVERPGVRGVRITMAPMEIMRDVVEVIEWVREG